MVDKIRSFWHDQVPPWIPLALAILGGAFWIGQQQQSIIDRLTSVEKQVEDIEQYLRTEHKHGMKTSADPLPPGGVSSLQQPRQDAAAPVY